jgi:adenosylhomocysteinase
MKSNYSVKDIALSDSGKLNIEYAELNMPALLSIRERFKKEQPFLGLTIGLALHVTKETAVLVRTLIAGGAKVALASCNPLSTQDDVAAALAKEGVNVYAIKGETKEEYYDFLNRVLDQKPHITIDDGCDLVHILHTKRTDLLPNIIGGCEETTTGIIRLRSMEKEGALKYPVVAVNDNKTKHLLDNYYGTGQSAIDGIVRATNTLLSGKTFVIAGYGDCGKGVAKIAKGMGSNVVITEIDPFCALQAKLDGFQVMPMAKACKIGDIFLTVTGNKWVVRLEHIKNMKEGAILANAGHFDIEIDVAALDKIGSKRKIRPFLDEYSINGKKVYLCAEGRLVNLAAAEGHPSEVMTTSFAGQALACEYIVKNKGKLQPKVILLPESIDQKIAALQIKCMGLEIDTLTKEQEKYLSSWNEGT